MVNRVDGAIRTKAQKPSSAARKDGRIRTVTQKEPAAAGFAHSFGTVI